MKNPLVSIITPTYNQERYLPACVQSVLNQTYSNWEQIIVDDGSTDRTREIAESFTNPRIRYIRLPHRGLASLAETYNAALSEARGDLIGILEGDDFWPPDKLALQMHAFDPDDVMISWGRAELIDEQGKLIGERASIRASEGRLFLETAEAFQRLTRVNILTPSVTVIVRRDVLDRAGGFRQAGSSLVVDLPTWLWITARERGRVCYFDEILGSYRVYERQTSQLYRAEMAAGHLQIVLEIEAALGPDWLREAGWDRRVRNRALVGGMIAVGLVRLEQHKYGEAARQFGRALLDSRSLAEGGKAAVGLASALIRRNLLVSLYGAREKWNSR